MNERNPFPKTKQHTAFFLRLFLWLIIFGLSILALGAGLLFWLIKSGILYNPTGSFFLYFAAFFLGFLFLALIFALFISLRIAGPLARLKNLMENMAEGDFSQDISIRDNDELYSLAIALRHISEKISFRLENLELAIRYLRKLADKHSAPELKDAAEETLTDFYENFKYKRITK